MTKSNTAAKRKRKRERKLRKRLNTSERAWAKQFDDLINKEEKLKTKK